MDKYHVIKRPMLTEKSTAINSDQGKYVFQIDYKATKSDVKAAVEAIYKVSVVKVNTMIHRSGIKRNRFGFTGGKFTKKAVVKLKDGQAIELF